MVTSGMAPRSLRSSPSLAAAAASASARTLSGNSRGMPCAAMAARLMAPAFFQLPNVLVTRTRGGPGTPVVDGLCQDQVVVAHGVDIACRNRAGAVCATAGAGDETAAADVLVDAGHSGRRPGQDAAQPAMASSIPRAAPDRDQGKISDPCGRGPPAADHVEHDEWRRSAPPPLDGARQRMTFFVEVNDLDNDVTPVMVPGTAAHSQVARTDFLAFRGGFRRFFGAAFLRARRSSAISRVTSPGSIPCRKRGIGPVVPDIGAVAPLHYLDRHPIVGMFAKHPEGLPSLSGVSAFGDQRHGPVETYREHVVVLKMM